MFALLVSVALAQSIDLSDVDEDDVLRLLVLQPAEQAPDDEDVSLSLSQDDEGHTWLAIVNQGTDVIVVEWGKMSLVDGLGTPHPAVPLDLYEANTAHELQVAGPDGVATGLTVVEVGAQAPIPGTVAPPRATVRQRVARLSPEDGPAHLLTVEDHGEQVALAVEIQQGGATRWLHVPFDVTIDHAALSALLVEDEVDLDALVLERKIQDANTMVMAGAIAGSAGAASLGLLVGYPGQFPDPQDALLVGGGGAVALVTGAVVTGLGLSKAAKAKRKRADYFASRPE